MLDHDERAAILALSRKGYGPRAIARALRISRNAVRRVLRSGQVEVPRFDRESELEPHLELVRRLFVQCEGNLVRVGEELERRKIASGYSTLTAFCRRHAIGTAPKKPAGQYVFEPGQEMQHDTSPHEPLIAGRRRRVQCASVVLCFSRRIFAQVYARFTRFECRAFLTRALVHFDGACERAVIDNSSVIVASSSGKDAVMAPAMEALAKRFGFRFLAHELGDANRSARVERPFYFIERNFYPGRTFADIDDLNRQLLEWCHKVDNRPKRTLGGRTPNDLFALEQPAMKRLPLHVPEVYDLHVRRADVDGYVSLHTNRYSVPGELIGRMLELRESLDIVRVFDGSRLAVEHRRREPGAHATALLPQHRHDRRRTREQPPSPEQERLERVNPLLGELARRLRVRHGGQARRAMRELERLWRDYPDQPLLDAIRVALDFDLVDLVRIERMTLERIAGDFFRLAPESGDDDDDSEDGDG